MIILVDRSRSISVNSVVNSFLRHLHSSALPGQHVLRQLQADRDGEILHAQVLREILLPIVHGGRPAAGEGAPYRQHEKKKEIHPANAHLRTRNRLSSVLATHVITRIDSGSWLAGFATAKILVGGG